MITQRTRSGGTANAAAMAGNAMFMVESSETTNAPAAAAHRITGRMMARHARSPDVDDPDRHRAARLHDRWDRRLRRRHPPAAGGRLDARHPGRGAGADGHDALRQPCAHLVEPA